MLSNQEDKAVPPRAVVAKDDRNQKRPDIEADCPETVLHSEIAISEADGSPEEDRLHGCPQWR